MGWIVIVVVVAVIGVVGWLLWSKSRRSATPPPAPAPTPRVSRVTDPTPMTGLEVALDQVTDRSGHTMRDKIETSTAIDDLIVPDDTGPILRRALDNVEHAEPLHPVETHDTAPDAAAPEPAGGGDTTSNDG